LPPRAATVWTQLKPAGQLVSSVPVHAISQVFVPAPVPQIYFAEAGATPEQSLSAVQILLQKPRPVESAVAGA
jgi:hypothetical protein